MKNYFQEEVAEEIAGSPKMFLLAQENAILKNTIEEYKEINTKFESMFLEEKAKNEHFIECNTELKTKNDYLCEENKKLQDEIARLKNRNFFKKLFNIY